MAFFENIDLPKGQQWFIWRMKQLVPTAMQDGVCSGIAHMGMQAFLARDTEHFDQRLKLIDDIPLYDFRKTIDSLNKKRLDIIHQVKTKLGPYRKLTTDESSSLENLPEVQDFLNATATIIDEEIKAGKLSAENRAREFQKRKDMHLFNVFIQKAIAHAMENLSADEDLQLSIPIFLRGIDIYQQPFDYDEFYRGNQNQTIADLNDFDGSTLINPTTFEISKIADFSGAYTQNDLIDYFNSLKQCIESIDPPITEPIALIFRSSNHAISVGYDPNLGIWQFINANCLPTRCILNTKTLAEQVLTSLSTNGTAVFSTEIFVNKNEENKFNQFYTLWKKDDVWQKLHNSFTADRVNLVDYQNSSWLTVATKRNKPELVKKLLAAKADPNLLQNKIGQTPLFFATLFGNLEIIKLLLASNADPNLFNREENISPLSCAALHSNTEAAKMLLAAKAEPNIAQKRDGETALYWACLLNNIDLIKELLAAKANPNAALKHNGMTPLHTAVASNNLELVKILLAAKANPNIASTTESSTPLFVAAQEGRTDLAKLLLLNNADSSIALKSTVAKLRQFAKGRQVEEAMEKFFQQKLLTPAKNSKAMTMLTSLQNIDEETPISMTPAEIATVMGHTAIAQFIQLQDLSNIKNKCGFSIFANQPVNDIAAKKDILEDDQALKKQSMP